MAIRINYADEAFSDYVRTRDGWECVRCSDMGKISVFRPPNRIIGMFPVDFADRYRNAMGLHNMHCFGRRGRSTRFDEKNCISGCYGCHSYLDEHPDEKKAFFRKHIGDAEFDELERRSKGIVKHQDEREIAEYYRMEMRKLCLAL